VDVVVAVPDVVGVVAAPASPIPSPTSAMASNPGLVFDFMKHSCSSSDDCYVL
jgi:hypothetical protein